MKAKSMSALIIAVVLLLIMLQNTQNVTVRLLFWEVILPQIFLIFLTLAFGLLLGYLIAARQAGGRKP